MAYEAKTHFSYIVQKRAIIRNFSETDWVKLISVSIVQYWKTAVEEADKMPRRIDSPKNAIHDPQHCKCGTKAR